MEIICYLSNGYPTIEASYNMAVEYADAGCRMMEVDFPSRNPYLESDYIAGRMKKALEACDDYEKYMDSIVAIQKRLPDVKILVLAYENTVEEIGVDRFIEFCLTNNLKDSTPFVVHKIQPYDTLDSLSLHYYGRPDYYWIIADFNRIQDPLAKITSLKSIKIPNISSIEYED